MIVIFSWDGPFAAGRCKYSLDSMIWKGKLMEAFSLPEAVKNLQFSKNTLDKVFKMTIFASKYFPTIWTLKVPKREIVDHSDFHDFYAIKSLTVNDFGVKIKICLKNI